VGNTSAVVGGLASPHYAHFMYLEKRRAGVHARLVELAMDLPTRECVNELKANLSTEEYRKLG